MSTLVKYFKIGVIIVATFITVVLILIVLIFTNGLKETGIRLVEDFEEVQVRNEGQLNTGMSIGEAVLKKDVSFKLISDNLKILNHNYISVRGGELSESVKKPEVVDTYTSFYKVIGAPFGDGYAVDFGLVENLLDIEAGSQEESLMRQNSIKYTTFDEELGWELQGGIYVSVGVLEELSNGDIKFNGDTEQLECFRIPQILVNFGPVGTPYAEPKNTPVHNALVRLQERLRNYEDDWTVEVEVNDYFQDHRYILSKQDGYFNWLEVGQPLRIFDKEGMRYFVFDETQEAAIFLIEQVPGLRMPTELNELLSFDFSYHLVTDYGYEEFQDSTYFCETHVVLGKYRIKYFMDDAGALLGFNQMNREEQLRRVSIVRKYKASQEIFKPVLFEGEVQRGETDELPLLYERLDLTWEEFKDLLISRDIKPYFLEGESWG